MEIRELKGKDLYRFSKMLRKMNIRREVKGLITDVTGKTEEEKKAKADEIALEVAFIVLENIGNAEKEANHFFGDLVGLKPEEFAELSFKEIADIVKTVMQQEDFQDFFEQAVQ